MSLLHNSLISVWLLLTGPVLAHDLGPHLPVPEKQTVIAAPSPQNWTLLPAQTPALSLMQEGEDPHKNPALKISYALPPAASAHDNLVYGLLQPLPELDAGDYDHLAFWIRGFSHEGRVPEMDIQFQRPDPALPGKQAVAHYRLGGISDEWKRVVIPLNQIIGIDQWNRLNNLTLVLPLSAGHSSGSLSLGGISLIKTGLPGPSRYEPLIPEQRAGWAASLGSQAALRTRLRERLQGWPTRFRVDPASLPRDDAGFLSQWAADTWRGIAALTDRHHALPIDRLQLTENSLAPEEALPGDYTNVSTIGLYLLALVSAQELGLLERAQALDHLAQTLTTLESLETYHGFFYNYYNTTTLERTSHFISFVDSAWLTAGLMVVRQAYPDMAARCTRLIEAGDYRFFYDPETRWMRHGYHVNLDQPSNMHYGVLYAESRLASLIAIGKGDVPEEHWFSLVRTFPPEAGWQSQPPRDRSEQTVEGHHWVGGYYQWRDYRYVPSWGGSLFEALMPLLVLDETQYAPKGLGYNDRIHTLIHRQYALEELNYPVWGMSPSSTPGSTAYGEYGIKWLGSAGYASGVVTPHVSALALMTEPGEALSNLRTLAARYPIYGDFGFYDAVSPISGQVAYSYLSVDQTMILIALANHLKNHVVQRYFAEDPWIKRILPLLSVERMEPA